MATDQQLQQHAGETVETSYAAFCTDRITIHNETYIFVIRSPSGLR